MTLAEQGLGSNECKLKGNMQGGDVPIPKQQRLILGWPCLLLELTIRSYNDLCL